MRRERERRGGGGGGEWLRSGVERGQPMYWRGREGVLREGVDLAHYLTRCLHNAVLVLSSPPGQHG